MLTLRLPDVATLNVDWEHHVPEDAIRRRFKVGLDNFRRIYQPLVDAWVLYDNSGEQPVLLEWGESNDEERQTER